MTTDATEPKQALRQYNVRLPDQLHKELRRESFDSNRSLNDLTVTAIALYLDLLREERE